MGSVRSGVVIVLVIVVAYLVWSGSGCVSQGDMRVEEFRTPHQVIEGSTLPEESTRTDAHVVYRNRAKEDFNFSALPEETRRLINGSDLEGDLIPLIGSDYEQYTLLVAEARFYNTNSDMAVDCVKVNEGRYSSMTVHTNLTLSDEEEDNPGAGELAYQRVIVRVPGPIEDRSQFRFRVKRDGGVVRVWHEEPTLHG